MWRGTASELLTEFERRVDPSYRRPADWPKGLSQFTGLLRRLAPNLRTFGVLVEFSREAGTGRRLIELRIDDSVIEPFGQQRPTPKTELITSPSRRCDAGV